MIKTADLFSIAKTGVNASNRLLNTTSNNIANINTEGYVRERTEFKSRLTGGVDVGFTDRVLNQFAQNQLRRDITSVGEAQAYYDRIEGLDNVLASEANSISASMTRFFSSISTAADDPTNMPSRDSVLGEAQGMVNRIRTLGDFMEIKEQELDQQIEDSVTSANALIRQIGELNEAIAVVSGSSAVDTPSTLLNERDLAIRKLAEFVSIEVRNSPNNDTGLVVNLTSGESLVLADGAFNVIARDGEPDFTNRQLVLSTTFTGQKNNTSLNIEEQEMGGVLGGLYRYREQVLEPAQRDLGKLAVALADTVNTANRRGLDLDQQLGGNIFAIPDFSGINYPDNSDLNLSIQGRFTPGLGGEVSNTDYQVSVLDVFPGSPDQLSIRVAALNNDGTPQFDSDGNPISEVYTIDAERGTYNEVMGGIELEFASGSSYQAGDQFLFQPLRRVASNLSMETNRAEDLAFAKPLRVNVNQDNLGDAVIRNTFITNSQVDMSLSSPYTSGFNDSKGLHAPGESPAPGLGAPAVIRITSDENDLYDYEVLDNAGNVITTVADAPNLENMLARAASEGTGPTWPTEFAAFNDYPGYDLTLEGRPKGGDQFEFGFNTDGLADNRNAVEMAELQQRDFVRQSTGENTNKSTFNEAYSSIVGQLGAQTANASVDLEAARVMQVQSSDWYESTAGVSLDEEAANLIQFQQSYAAAARILTTAQELFDTILAAAR